MRYCTALTMIHCWLLIGLFGCSRTPEEVAASKIRAIHGRAASEEERLTGKVAPGKPVIKVDLKLRDVSGTRLAPLRDLPHLRSLDLTLCYSLNDETIKYLEGLKDLKELWMMDTSVSNAGLQYLRGLTGLELLRSAAQRN